MLGLCTFTVGDGTGEPGRNWEEHIGNTDTPDECAYLVRRNEPSANGVTWGGGACYAEFGATSHNGDVSYRTCLFRGQLL